MIPKITCRDIAARHPLNLSCGTDAAYASLAVELYELLREQLKWIEPEPVRQISISLALYFEDIQSSTHQFDVFLKFYRQWYGFRLPFFPFRTAVPEDPELDAMNFVLWLFMMSETDYYILNPLTEIMRPLSKDLLDFWKKRKRRMPSNEDLAVHIFCEETLSDAMMVRDVLAWIESRGFLGRWKNSLRSEETDDEQDRFFKDMSSSMRCYGTECLNAFSRQAWPMSLPSTLIYAEMIRMDMKDDSDPAALAVEQMQYRPLGEFLLDGASEESCHLVDKKGEGYQVVLSTRQDIASVRKHRYLTSGLFSYQGLWYLNGLVSWRGTCSDDAAAFCKDIKAGNDSDSDYKELIVNYIENHGHERLYFFKNIRECKTWLKKDLGVPSDGKLPDSLSRGWHLAIYLDPAGGFEVLVNANCIRHPLNPFFVTSVSDEESFVMIMGSWFSPEAVRYLMANDLVPGVVFPDSRGQEHGRVLMQDNLDFMVRCMRRDIRYKEVIRQRDPQLAMSDDEILSSGEKLPFVQFVLSIEESPILCSRAGKRYRLMECDSNSTRICVPSGDEITIPTEKLYQAHLALSENEIQVAALEMFVGRQQAPAASALLYSVVGGGRRMSYFRNAVARLFPERF